MGSTLVLQIWLSAEYLSITPRFTTEYKHYAPKMAKRLRCHWRQYSEFSSWCLDEMYVKVDGRWAYLYRAVDSSDHTLDFYLSPQRNTQAAFRFLRKLFTSTKYWQIPRMIHTDKTPTYGRALTLLKQEDRCPPDIQHSQSKYQNNVIECDYSKLKRIINATLGFQSIKTAYAIIKGIEVMRALRKGTGQSILLWASPWVKYAWSTVFLASEGYFRQLNTIIRIICNSAKLSRCPLN